MTSRAGWIALRLVLVASLALAACGTSWAGASPDRPRVSHYRMELRLQPRERSLQARTTMTVANTTTKP